MNFSSSKSPRNIRLDGRNSSIRSKSNSNSSCSIHRLNLSSSCSNRMFPSRVPVKKLPLEPWQRLFDGEKKRIYSHQGLTMKKNHQTIDAIIDEDFFNLKDEKNSSNESNGEKHFPADIEKHLDDLYEQIDDLVLQLSEERLNHRLYKKEVEENFSKESEKQNQKFQEFLHHQMISHQHEMEQINEHHRQKLHQEKLQFDEKEEKLFNQIEFLKSSFHSFKINLEKENEENLRKRIDENVQTLKKQSEEKDDEMKRKLNESILKERKSLVAKHKIDVENIRKQHQRDLETIQKTFASSAFDRTRVESLTKELTTLQLEFEEIKERNVQLTSKLKDLEIQHAQTMRDLNDFRTRFDEKSNEIEQTYAGKLDRLHLENADLRNLYLKKCAELVEERLITQAKTQNKVQMTRKQLRQKLLNVRIASATPLITDDEPHRLTPSAHASQANSMTYQDSIVSNIRREMKLTRRSSQPITEDEFDLMRYLTSNSSMIRRSSSSISKYNFENDQKMIENLSLEDLQKTFKSI